MKFANIAAATIFITASLVSLDAVAQTSGTITGTMRATERRDNDDLGNSQMGNREAGDGIDYSLPDTLIKYRVNASIPALQEILSHDRWRPGQQDDIMMEARAAHQSILQNLASSSSTPPAFDRLDYLKQKAKYGM